MAKAAMFIQGGQWELDFGMVVHFDVVTDTAISVSSTTPFDLVRASTLVTNDLKAICRQMVLDQGGPVIADVDITLFGGPA